MLEGCDFVGFSFALFRPMLRRQRLLSAQARPEEGQCLGRGIPGWVEREI